MSSDQDTHGIIPVNSDDEEIHRPVQVGDRVIYPSGKITDAETGEELVNDDGEVIAPVNNESVSTEGTALDRHRPLTPDSHDQETHPHPLRRWGCPPAGRPATAPHHTHPWPGSPATHSQ